jgi:hypothetical protein
MTEAAPATFTVTGSLSLGYEAELSDSEIATEEANVETNLAQTFGGSANCVMTLDSAVRRRILAFDYTAAFTVADVSAEKMTPSEETLIAFGAALDAGSAFNITVEVGAISAAATTGAPTMPPTEADTSSAQHYSLSFGFLTLLMSLIINW